MKIDFHIISLIIVEGSVDSNIYNFIFKKSIF